jgi:hypothetical protein
MQGTREAFGELISDWPTEAHEQSRKGEVEILEALAADPLDMLIFNRIYVLCTRNIRLTEQEMLLRL